MALRILIVSRKPETRSILTALLRDHGCTVRLSETLPEIRAILAAGTVDLVVTTCPAGSPCLETVRLQGASHAPVRVVNIPPLSTNGACRTGDSFAGTRVGIDDLVRAVPEALRLVESA